jgi:peptide/nickel transport system ATP-binding protein
LAPFLQCPDGRKELPIPMVQTYDPPIMDAPGTDTAQAVDTLLDVRDLSISFDTPEGRARAVDRVSFSLRPGETLGLVGESGCGKTVTALALMRLIQTPPGRIDEGQILFKGRDLLKLPEREMQKIRGNEISMVFQEPMTSLNPVTRCGKQVVEAIRAHQQISRKEAKLKALGLFREVQLPDPEGTFNAYPHEISGGQRQRVMIAMAVSSNPDILLADEPTTALDVTVQKEIIRLLKDLKERYSMAILFITHDLGLIREIADELLVMKNGMIIESGPVKEIFTNPKHPYTRELLECRSRLDLVPGKPPAGYGQNALLEAENLHTTFRGKGKRREVKAVNGISLKVYPGEVLGLVGESGCGKTTLGRTILHLIEPSSGSLRFGELDLIAIRRSELKKFRKDMQIIFQDPYSSLNPKMTVGKAITEPMLVHRIGQSYSERKKKALQLLGKVGLGEPIFHRYPHELSGGQRQRVCIARALSVEPKFIVCDESVSALDVSVQAQVLNLLKELKEEFGFTYIFISHDLAVVKFISDRIAVMKDGKIIETGTAEEIYFSPKNEYTKKLINSIPV